MKYDNIESAWEFGKSRSSYHFRTDIIDPRWDTVIGLGRFKGDWSEELAVAEQEAKKVNIHTRRNTWSGPNRGQHNSVKLNQGEVNDLQQIGGDDQHILMSVYHDLGPTFKKMVEAIGLADHESRIHIQFPTESFIGHIDRFDLNYPGVPQENLMRIGIMLKDWQQGQFFQFGNFPYQQWRAGDIHTFEYLHVPHYTANSGLSPRVTLFTTGIITDKTKKFIAKAKNLLEIEI
jgi:hypothetical protein